ncbi:hypothetical protein HPB50_021616 [Hyalomma asiaticum]|uniref:Uncharacterized protein n=1 Tax=Hyalomma asiaticum TaxID=266040 RepID=A0ACB7T0U3_HYAAI|nr:hypothetical protein HPB50_021616 [Hyalomma asiaticum]
MKGASRPSLALSGTARRRSPFRENAVPGAGGEPSKRRTGSAPSHFSLAFFFAGPRQAAALFPAWSRPMIDTCLAAAAAFVLRGEIS